MKDWELDRVYKWILTSGTIEPERGIKFLIDIEDKTIFTLVHKDNKWECVLNNEISVSYSKDDIEVLNKKIGSIERGEKNILEFPRLSQNQLDDIENAKMEFKTKTSEKSEIDTMEFNRRIYVKPADLGVKWLKKIGVEITETKIIGF